MNAKRIVALIMALVIFLLSTTLVYAEMGVTRSLWRSGAKCEGLELGYIENGKYLKIGNLSGKPAYLGFYEHFGEVRPEWVIVNKSLGDEIIGYLPDIDFEIFDTYTAENDKSYENAFLFMKSVDDKTTFKDISKDNLRLWFDQEYGLDDTSTQASTRTLLADLFLLAYINKTSFSKMTEEQLDRVRELFSDYTPSNLFFEVLHRTNKTFKDVNSLEQLVDIYTTAIREKKKETTDVYSNNLITTRYINKMTSQVILSKSYDDVKTVIYSLTTTDADTNIQNMLNQIVTNLGLQSALKSENGVLKKDEVLKAYWDHIDNYYTLTTTHKYMLYSIIRGRGSPFSIAKREDYRLDIKWNDGVKADENAAINAVSLASSVDEKLKSIADEDLETKQLKTLSLRLQYHYYAMQSVPTVDSEVKSLIDELSTSESGEVFYRELEPSNIGDVGIINTTEYIRFMNVVNEIAVYKPRFTSDSELAGLTVASKTTDGILKKAEELRQMKAAVSFIESLPFAYDVEQVKKMWYDKDPTASMSLEDLYQLVANLGLDADVQTDDAKKNEKRPLSEFFDDDGKLSGLIKIGIAQSSMYVPLQTNVYEPYTYSSIDNEDFFSKFHNMWGYNRKALYMDTSKTAATTLYNTGKKGKLRPALLRDLINQEGDIVLYSDTALYNANRMQTLEDKALSTGKAASSVAETAEQAVSGKWDIIEDRMTKSISGAFSDLWSNLSKSLSLSLSSYEETLKDDWKMKEGDDTALGGKDIDKYLHQENYSELKPLAVQSAILRDSKTVDMIQPWIKKPVFISSKTLAKQKNASSTEKNTYLNYVLLKNIGGNAKVEYKTSMDYNSPVYLDAYGNILTETGYIVVPVMANASINESYDPYTAAFIGTYGNSYSIPKEYADCIDSIKDLVELNEEKGIYEFKAQVEGGVIDFQRLSTNSEETQSRLFNLARGHIEEGSFSNKKYIVNVLLEVMRGAPMDKIDKQTEGLKSSIDVSRAGVVQANKLDDLKKALGTSEDSTIIAPPNLAYMGGVEYAVLFVYKVTMLIIVFLLLWQIFSLAMTGGINIFTIPKMILTVAITVSVLYVIPVTYETTYYQVNKYLLQSEAEYISLLNLEKEENGMERGMKSVNEPTINTKLLLQIEDVNIPWYKLFMDIIYAPLDSNFSKIYSDYAKTNMAASATDFETIGDGLYLDVQDLYDSSTVVFNPNYKCLYQYNNGDIPASFYVPYYVFLDALIYNVNTFNSDNNLYSYTTSTFKGGKVKSIGLAKEYFNSDSFINSDNIDILYLNQIYKVPINGQINSPFNEETDVGKMRESLWFNDNLNEDDVRNRIEIIYGKAKEFVSDNRDLLGRISDETFLKVMALSMAIDYNVAFGVDSCQSLEIYKLSSDDLIRVSILPREDVIKGSAYSYSRFVFEYTGTIGVYEAAILEIIIFAASWIRPAMLIILFVCLYGSVFINKLILQKEDVSAKGFMKLILILSVTNLTYGVLLKASTLLPNVGLPPTVNILCLIVLHVIFLILNVGITLVVFTNWRDLGSGKFSNIGRDIVSAVGLGSKFSNESIEDKRKGNTKDSGWEYYKILHDNDKQRVYKVEREDDI